MFRWRVVVTISDNLATHYAALRSAPVYRRSSAAHHDTHQQADTQQIRVHTKVLATIFVTLQSPEPPNAASSVSRRSEGGRCAVVYSSPDTTTRRSAAGTGQGRKVLKVTVVRATGSVGRARSRPCGEGFISAQTLRQSSTIYGSRRAPLG